MTFYLIGFLFGINGLILVNLHIVGVQQILAVIFTTLKNLSIFFLVLFLLFLICFKKLFNQNRARASSSFNRGIAI